MRLPILVLTLVALAAQRVSAVTWYYLRWVNSNGFTSVSGTMKVPPLPRAATYYVWPGLQPPDNSGVMQQVLDGRSGTWWIGSGWCCSSPSLSWGGGFNTRQGDTVDFSMTVASDGHTWDTSLSLNGGTPVTNSFDLTSSHSLMNQVFLAIELYDVSWDFGPLEYDNVVIKANSADTAWCTNGPGNDQTIFSITGTKASASGGTSTCTMSTVILESPA